LVSTYIVYSGIHERDDMHVVSPMNGELVEVEYKVFKNNIGKANKCLIVSLPITAKNINYLNKGLLWFYADDTNFVLSRVFLTNYIDEHKRRLIATEVFVANNYNELKSSLLREFKYPQIFSKDRSPIEYNEKIWNAFQSGRYRSGINYPIEKIDLSMYEYKDWRMSTDPYKYGVIVGIIALVFGAFVCVKRCGIE
jgi:hypothetical protein